MSIDMFAEYLNTVGDNHSLVETEEITQLGLAKTIIEPLRRVVAEALSQSLTAKMYAVEESVIAAEMSRLLARSELEKVTGDPYCRLKKHRIVARVTWI